MATTQLYNHTATRFVNGFNAGTDTYRLMLCSTAIFDATNTTLAGITKTEITANGYTSPGQALTSVTLNTATTNDAAFDAADVTWTVASGTMDAAYGILYNDSDANDPPVAFLDFGGMRSVSAPNTFSVIWNSSGIILFNVA